jgi:hypothetical protein
MRALFGIAERHSMTASAMQAARRAAVASSWANAAVGIPPMSKPAAASISMGILIMTISRPLGLGRRRRPCGQLNDSVCRFNAVIHGYPDFGVAFLDHYSGLFGSFSRRV